MKKVLITGVTGFVGSTLVHYFSGKDGIKLTGHSRDPKKVSERFPGISMEIISECSAGQLDAMDIDCVIHLAGIAHDLSNRYVEADYYKVNFENTVKLYDEFLKSKAATFIYLSSIKAVVDATDYVLEEDELPRPVTPYGKSKLKAEEYITSHALASKRYHILRPCIIHGPGNKGNLNLLYKFVKSGVPYPFGAFDNKRSFLGSDNLAFAIEQLIVNPIESGVYNLSDDGSLSTNEVVALIASALGKSPRIWNLPQAPVRFLFRLAGKKKTLEKLTKNMEVSNRKILRSMHKSFPMSIREGLKKTILSFHE